MADIDLTGIDVVNMATAVVYDVPFKTGHTVGDAVKPDGTIITAATDEWGGIVIVPGDANGHRTLVLYQGLVEGVAGAGAAANAIIFNDGDNTFSDAELAGVAGTGVWRVGKMITATRALIAPQFYEKGA